MSLFKSGNFTLHSGDETFFKIDCDALDDEDLDTLAMLIMEMVPWFTKAEGVPTGGLRLAERLNQFAVSKYAGTMKINRKTGETTAAPILICDDVLTTGASMEEHRAGRNAYGIVIFARGKCPDWVRPIFTMTSND